MPWFQMANRQCPTCRKRMAMPGQKRCSRCMADKNITDRKFDRIPGMSELDAELNRIAEYYDEPGVT